MGWVQRDQPTVVTLEDFIAMEVVIITILMREELDLGMEGMVVMANMAATVDLAVVAVAMVVLVAVVGILVVAVAPGATVVLVVAVGLLIVGLTKQTSVAPRTIMDWL